jgi:hypothetical protein
LKGGDLVKYGGSAERATETKKIIDIDPIWTMQGLADKYLFYKEIYDWLKANGKI